MNDPQDSNSERIGRPFQKGQSGNPGGQPKWVKAIRDALRDECVPLATRHLKRVLGGRVDTADEPETETALYAEVTPKDRSQAAEIVLAYTLPKPKQSVKLSGDRKNPINPLSGFTPEQLLALAQEKKEGA